MTNLEIIERLRESTFADEDGEKYSLEFQPALTEQEIEALKPKFPMQIIDEEILEILKVTKGWDGYGLDAVYFDAVGDFGFWELSPRSITLGHDGFGNVWILDLDEKGKPGKVFFACHDPAVFVIHSQNLNEYLHHLLEFYELPHTCHLNEVHDKTVIDIWNNNKLCLSKTEFLKQNSEYNGFLQKFADDDWTVADLRSGNNKAGFAWGKFGPNQHTQRHEKDLIWVIKNKKKSFLSRLLGS